MFPFGLRVRMLLALVATSAVTLLAAAAVLLQPLQTRLRDESRKSLRAAVLSARPQLDAAIRGKGDADAIAVGIANRTNAQSARIYRMRDNELNLDPSLFGDDVGAIYRGFADPRVSVVQSGNGITLTVPLAVYTDRYRTRVARGVLQVRKTDTNLTQTVDEVRGAFVTAAIIGLGVAIFFGLILATTLSRRLGRLRMSAVRIVREGTDAPVPRDTTRDEVGDLARAMAAMQRSLRRQEEARRRFVSTASHELRTPLTSLGGTLELLDEDLERGDVDVADARAQVRAASVQVQALTQLASELLDLSRLDAGIELRAEPVELGELTRAVGAEFGQRAREHSQRLEVLAPTGPCWAKGDPSEVARIVRILIDNALRYTPDGGSVRVEPAYNGQWATLAVEDDGPGVPADEREAIFERFRRGRATGAVSGFGLGLAIGRELARRQGGDLEYDEARSQGASFVLRLGIEMPSGGGAHQTDVGQDDDAAAAGTSLGLR